MIRPALALALAALGGCNAIFGLDAASVPGGEPDAAGGDGAIAPDADIDARTDAPSVIPCAEHDEDNDAINDCADSCPHVRNNGDSDLDTDGVGLACDDRPSESDRLVAFHAGTVGNPTFSELPATAWKASVDALAFMPLPMSDGSLQTVDTFSQPSFLQVHARVTLPPMLRTWRIAVRFGSLACVLSRSADTTITLALVSDQGSSTIPYEETGSLADLTLTRMPNKTASCKAKSPTNGGAATSPGSLADVEPIAGSAGIDVNAAAYDAAVEYLLVYTGASDVPD